VSDSNDTPWYSNGLRFNCLQCGRCCSGRPGYVWVTGQEILRIAAFCGSQPEHFVRQHIRRVARGHSLLEKPNGDCEFLERVDQQKSRCAIYPVRPAQCRTWPFWPSNLGSAVAWRLAGCGCPGIDVGPLHSLATIQDCLRRNGHRPL